MKTSKTKSTPSRTTLALLTLLATPSLHAQTIHYQFTGTVEGTDPFIAFSSPESPIPGLEVEIGDQLSGTFEVFPRGLNFSHTGNGAPPPSPDSPGLQIYGGNVSDFRVRLKGHELIPEIEKGTPTFSAGDIENLDVFVTRLTQQEDKVSKFLSEKIRDSTRDQLLAYDDSRSDVDTLQSSLIQDLNSIILGASIYEVQRFSEIVLRPETKVLLYGRQQGVDFARLNRHLIEDAYPTELTRPPRTTTGGDSLLVNDRSAHIGWLELDPLAPGQADVITITTPIGGIRVGPQPNLGISLNLTDSSATALQPLSRNAPFPVDIDFELFDVTKGFIRLWEGESQEGDSGSADWGIMFNIDSLEPFAPAVTAPVKLSIGSHVTWPTDAEGYILEEAETVEGPWTQSEKIPAMINGQNSVEMDRQGRSKFYRLVKAE